MVSIHVVMIFVWRLVGLVRDKERVETDRYQKF